MALRLGAVAVLALLLLAAMPLAPAETGSTSTPASFQISEANPAWMRGAFVMLREVAWHPGGEYALIAGGVRGPSTDPSAGWSFLLAYDNATGLVRPVVNESGPMLFAVKFHPSGDHALVIGEKNSILRYDDATGAIRNLWAEFQTGYLTDNPGKKPPVFLSRGLAYRPDGEFAIITGNAMIGYQDGTGFFPLESGEMKYFKAIGVSPDSSYAIVEGGDTDAEGHARIGQLWFLGFTEERCARYFDPDPRTGRPPARCMAKFRIPYGLFEPNRSDPADITFHPIINASFVYGYDDTHGTILRIRDNGTRPEQRAPGGDYVPEWMQANHKKGKYTDMEFRPGGSRALVTALGDPQLMEFDGLKIRPIITGELCAANLEPFEDGAPRRCPELESVAWHPSGAYALSVGLYGAMIKITPQPEPEVTVEAPKASETIVDRGQASVMVRGKAYASAFGARISNVTVVVDDGPPNEASVGKRFNPTNWFWSWNLTRVEPGEHRITVVAEDDQGHASRPVSFSVFVALPPPPLDRPTIEGENLTSAKGDFGFSWTAVEGAVTYEVQDARDEDFRLERVVWPVDTTSFESLARDKGTFYFRVRAVGDPRPSSEWSNVLRVDVTEGRVRSAAGPPDDELSPPPGGSDVLNQTWPGNDSETPDDPDPETPDDGEKEAPPPPASSPTPGLGALAVAITALAVAVVASRRR